MFHSKPLQKSSSVSLIFAFRPTEIPLDIIKPLSDIHAKENDEISFECKVNRPGLKPRWVKDGRDVIPDGRFETSSRQDSCILRISNVCLEDEGKYSCIIRNLRTDGKLYVEGNLTMAKMAIVNI